MMERLSSLRQKNYVTLHCHLYEYQLTTMFGAFTAFRLLDGFAWTLWL